ncbi:MAG: phasin family protein [Pseudomonadota bacterium]
MTQNPFAMPKEVRELTERNIEQAQAAFGQFSDAMSQAMIMWTNAMPSNNVTSGFGLVQERAMHYAKQNADAGLSLAHDIAKAGDIQEILALQTTFAQKQMQSYAQQTQELGLLMTEAGKNAAATMKKET